MVKLFLTEGPLLFHDERKAPYVRLQKSPRQTFRLRSMDFRTKLSGLLWKAEGKAPGSEALNSALNVLHHLALEGPMVSLHNRVARHGDAIYLDLADDQWRAMKIAKEGWKVEEAPDLFRRYEQQLPITEPIHGGDPWKLLDCLNIREEDRLLFMVYIATLFIPDIPHAILMLHGPQGSAKTTLMDLLKDLMDPSAIGVAALPRDERELIQALDHSYLNYYDNAGSLPAWTSDALCRATTGGGFSKRQLYTDDEDIIYRLQRPVGINGINIAAQRPDLLDRSLLIGLEQIPETRRRTIMEIRAEFSRDQPAILGGFLDVVVKALSMPEPKLDRTYRMADFISWGYRMAEALGRLGEEFITVYGENVRLQAEEAVRADIVAEVLLEFLDACLNQRWEGTATQLLNLLKAKAEDLHVSTRQREWPKASHALTRRLRQLRDPLSRIGYTIEFLRVQGGERRLSIEAGKVTNNTVEASIASPPTSSSQEAKPINDGIDAIDTISGTFLGDSQPPVRSAESGEPTEDQAQQPELAIQGKMAIGDLFPFLQHEFPEGGPRGDFVKFIAERGCWDQYGAESLVDRLRVEGHLYQDPEGYLRWMRGGKAPEPGGSEDVDKASPSSSRPQALCDRCFSQHRGAKVIGKPLPDYSCIECGDKATVIAVLSEEDLRS